MDIESISSIERLKISRRPFPLKYLLILYINSNSYCYLNYHAGLKLLADYLAPIELPSNPQDYPEIPRVFENWECREIAKILGTTDTVIYHTFREIIYGSAQ